MDAPSRLIVRTDLYSSNVLNFACIQVCNEVQALALYCRLYVVTFPLGLEKITSTWYVILLLGKFNILFYILTSRE